MAFVEFGIACPAALARDRFGFFLTSLLPQLRIYGRARRIRLSLQVHPHERFSNRYLNRMWMRIVGA